MSKLQFFFQEVLTEVDALAKVANSFVTPESRGVLQELKTSLELIQDSRSTSIRIWGISEKRPLKTIRSRHRDAVNLYAEITSLWQIRCVPEKKLSRTPERFALAGMTTTRVRLISTNDNQEVGMWRMEVGDHQSPGCHFHAQLEELSAPRLPAIHSTPMAVLEFVLGELFQDRWDQQVASSGPDLQRWAPIHRRWLGRLLNWQLDQVKNPGGAPWITLKRTKPSPLLFVEAE